MFFLFLPLAPISLFYFTFYLNILLILSFTVWLLPVNLMFFPLRNYRVPLVFPYIKSLNADHFSL